MDRSSQKDQPTITIVPIIFELSQHMEQANREEKIQIPYVPPALAILAQEKFQKVVP